MMMIGKASDSNYQSLMVHKHVISAKNNLVFHAKCEIFDTPQLSKQDAVLYGETLIAA